MPQRQRKNPFAGTRAPRPASSPDNAVTVALLEGWDAEDAINNPGTRLWSEMD